MKSKVCLEREELNRDRQRGEDFAATARRRGIFGARKNKKKEKKRKRSRRRAQKQTEYLQHSRRQAKKEQRQSGWTKEEGSWKKE